MLPSSSFLRKMRTQQTKTHDSRFRQYGLWQIKSRRMRWAGHVARMGDRRGVYRVLVEKSVGKRPFGRPRRKWEDNIKMDLQELGCGGYGLDRAGSG